MGVQLAHPSYILKDLNDGACVPYAKSFKRPVYYYLKDSKYRLALDEYKPIFLEFLQQEQLFDRISDWKRGSELFMIPPNFAVGNEGDVCELSPARKVRVLKREFCKEGLLFLDESPKYMSCGLGITSELIIKKFDNKWWQKYVTLKKTLEKLEQKRKRHIDIRQKLYTEFGDL